MKNLSLKINEIYQSIQGESSLAGMPCVFVRLTGCDLRCTYCDTTYAYSEGTTMTLDEILEKVERYGCKLVELTGGEPLLQKNVIPLMSALCDRGHTVLLETSGAHDISKVDPRVIRVMDLKTPGSKESGRNLWKNIEHLRPSDEVKFVIGSREDYEWARDVIQKHSLNEKVDTILFSPVFRREGTPRQTKGHSGMDAQLLVTWLLKDKLNVRFQLQLHKYIWPPEQRGV